MTNKHERAALEARAKTYLDRNVGGDDFDWVICVADFVESETRTLTAELEALKANVELEKAVQQFIGFGHYEKGHRVDHLIEAMGLTAEEYKAIREDIKISITARDFAEVEQYFKEQNAK